MRDSGEYFNSLIKGTVYSIIYFEKLPLKIGESFRTILFASKSNFDLRDSLSY